MRITRVGIAADHGGFALKTRLLSALRSAGLEVTDFGASELIEHDDYPDYVVPLARAVAGGQVQRGIALCGSGIGASIAANKVRGVRAGACSDAYSAHQGVEDDDMNVICIGARVSGEAMAWELVQTFLAAQFRRTDPYARRLEKVAALEAAPDDPRMHGC